MKTFLDFIENKKKFSNLYESFKEADLDKVNDLIYKSLSKHTDKHITPLIGYENIDDNGTKLTAKVFLVFNDKKKSASMFTINWNKSKSSMEAYSIDFYNDVELLFNGKAKTALTLYTMGSSVVYFLPIIWTLLNSGEYNITQAEAEKIGRQSIDAKNESYSYYVGGAEYKVYENLSDKVIDDTYDLIVEGRTGVRSSSDEVNDYVDKKRQQARSAENEYGVSDPKTKRLWSEWREIYNAIRNGKAESIGELKLAIKRNVQIIDELNSEEQKIEEEITKEREDPEVTFKKMQYYINLVIKGINNSVILCGAPGLGKTYRVQRTLKAHGFIEGENMYTIKGKCSPRVLYLRLYEYRQKGDIVVIDDADGLVGPKAPEDCINILKGALDTTSDDEGRLVAYGIGTKLYDDDGNTIPKRMHYNGGIIIITNYNAGALDTALRGRSFVQDINFSVEDALKLIKSRLPELGGPNLSSESRIKAFDYLSHLAEQKTKMEISFRTFIICVKLYESIKGQEDDEFIDSMIKDQMEMQILRNNKKY